MDVDLVTYRGVAHPWLCDAMGHLNTRHYVGMFDDATVGFLAMLGYRTREWADKGRGWVDARNVIEYESEVPPGDAVVVRTGIARLGTKSLTVRHEMWDAGGERRHATMEAVLVHFDLRARRALAIPEAFRERALAHVLPPEDAE